jgi:hypothetical protein
MTSIQSREDVNRHERYAERKDTEDSGLSARFSSVGSSDWYHSVSGRSAKSRVLL